jgi:hypothetical protein
MSTPEPETMRPEEQAIFTAMTERMRQLRRRRGVPNGVSLTDAVALHMLSTDEVERARWGDTSSPAPQAHASPS